MKYAGRLVLPVNCFMVSKCFCSVRTAQVPLTWKQPDVEQGKKQEAPSPAIRLKDHWSPLAKHATDDPGQCSERSSGFGLALKLEVLIRFGH